MSPAAAALPQVYGTRLNRVCCCRCMASIENSRQATWGLCKPCSSFVDWGPLVGLAEPAHIPSYAVPGGKCVAHGWLRPNTEGCCSWPHSGRSEELSLVHELQPSLFNPFVCSHSCIFPRGFYFASDAVASCQHASHGWLRLNQEGCCSWPHRCRSA